MASPARAHRCVVGGGGRHTLGFDFDIYSWVTLNLAVFPSHSGFPVLFCDAYFLFRGYAVVIFCPSYSGFPDLFCGV